MSLLDDLRGRLDGGGGPALDAPTDDASAQVDLNAEYIVGLERVRAAAHAAGDTKWLAVIDADLKACKDGPQSEPTA